MSKHTPGPWQIGKNFGSVVCDTPVPGIRGSDDTEYYGGHLIAESVTEANARLIAAAPELLEALHIQHACGAPAKANLYDEGGVEGWHWTHPDGREWTAAGAWDEAPPMHPVVRAAIAKATGEQA